MKTITYTWSIAGRLNENIISDINRNQKDLYQANVLFERQKAVEFRKLSTEFSKIIVAGITNLNAGGIVAVPTTYYYIHQSMKGSSGWPILTTGVPVSIYIAGVVAGLLCSFFSYRNFHFHAIKSEMKTDVITNEREVHPIRHNKNVSHFEKINLKIEFSYLLGLIVGWLSLACFSIASLTYISLLANGF